MSERIDYKKAAPGAFQAMLALEKYVRKSGLQPVLLELVKTRVSQINGWNRLAVPFHSEVGSYQPPATKAA